VLAHDLESLEPRLMRQGYNAKALADLLHVRQGEIRALFHGRLPPRRTQELQQEMLAAGLPL